MGYSNLNSLLTEYQDKRNFAILQAKRRKYEIYAKLPRLQEIDDELSHEAIATSKSVLLTNSTDQISSLNKKISTLKKEKAEILKNLNIDESYFQPFFNCNLCNDTGYTTLNHKTQMCKCLKQKIFDLEYNKLNVYNIKKQTFENFNIDLYSNKQNVNKYNSDISPRENMNRILIICQNFIKNFDSPEEKNLLFFGNSGLGKTFLSNCISNSILQTGKTVLYQTAPVMLDTIINYRLRKVLYILSRYL